MANEDREDRTAELPVPTRFVERRGRARARVPVLTILYHPDLDRAGHVDLRVYDLTGRERAVLLDEARPGGYHEVRFRAVGLPSGVYLYRLRAGGVTQTRSMTVLK